MSDKVRLRSGALEWREVEGEIVALDLRSSMYLGVNRTGALLWPTLAEGATREVLLERLTNAHEIDAATAARDLEEFLEALRRRDLLEDPPR
jgi:hypothetical protein